MPRAEGVRERLDDQVPVADRAASLADIDRLNRWFGGYALSLRVVARHAARLPAGRPLVVADVGGGEGRFAARLVSRLRRAGRAARVIVLDRDADGLALARAVAGRHPEIRLIRADAGALPLRDGAVDVVTASLTLHHLEPDEAAASLAEMRRAARTVVVNDLDRTRLGWTLVWLATRLFACHPISRHDGPLSVRRAYSAEELRVLAEKAGFQEIAIVRHPLIARLVMIAS